jgi:hypothetical protein
MTRCNPQRKPQRKEKNPNTKKKNKPVIEKSSALCYNDYIFYF